LAWLEDGAGAPYLKKWVLSFAWYHRSVCHSRTSPLVGSHNVFELSYVAFIFAGFIAVSNFAFCSRVGCGIGEISPLEFKHAHV
jgi:hypothetical protein